MRRLFTSRRRSRLNPAAFYPLVGALTVVVLVVAVYISYNANTGVPLQEKYTFSVDLPSANRLVKAAEVRIGGVQVGQIKSVEGNPPPNGERGSIPFARAVVQLRKDVRKVPVDSIASVRPASVLGATFLDIKPGRSPKDVPEGGLLPVGQARSTVELTDLLDLFDKRTAKGLQSALTSVGDGLAGRGPDFGQTITQTSNLLPALRRVTANFAAPETRLQPFIGSYQRFIGAFDAERASVGSGLEATDRTFGALDRVRPDLASTIDRLPGAARTTTVALRRLRPSLDRLATLSVQLRPAAERIPTGVTSLRRTLGEAIPALRLFGRAGRAVRPTGAALRSFTRSPNVDGFVRKTGDTAAVSAPLITSLKDAQVYCNSITTAFQNLASTFADDGIGKGPAVVTIRIKGLGGNPAEILQNGKTLPGIHTNYQPNQNENECEAGNEPYDSSKIDVSNPPGNESTAHVNTFVKPQFQQQAERTGLLREPPPAVTK